MTERQVREAAIEAEREEVALSEDEQRAVKNRQSAPARVVHEVVRRQGIEELERPLDALIWSGFAAGVTIGLSVLAKAVLERALPEMPGRDALAGLGYAIGFVVVILGRMQLFTESTLTAVLPVATRPSGHSLLRTLRLWVTVFLANMAGTFAFAGYVVIGGLGDPGLTEAAMQVSGAIMGKIGGNVFLLGIPAGFLLAVIVWTLPSAVGQQLWVILLLTWLIDLGGFAHVIAGAAETWILVLNGMLPLGDAIGGFLLPALAGNLVGGSVLFAVLAHAQVHTELRQD